MAFQAGTAFITVLPSMRAFPAQLKADLSKLNPELTVNVIPKLEYKLADAEATVAAERMSRDVHFNVDVDTGAAAAKMASFSKSFSALSTKSLGMAGLAQSFINLGAAIAPAAGALGLLPAVGVAAGAMVATLNVGLNGFGDALKNAGDPEKFAEALKGLAPAARDTAVAVQQLHKPFGDLQQAVQQHLFAGMASDIKALGNQYLPTLRVGMTGFADTLNYVAHEFTGFLSASSSTSDLGTIFNNSQAAVFNLGGALQPVLFALKDIVTVGSDLLPGLTAGAGGAAQAFADMVARMRESGALQQAISQGLSTIGQIGSILGNVASSVFQVFSAASSSGTNMLSVLEQASGALAGFLKSTEGAQLLTTVFGSIRQGVEAAMPLVSALASTLVSTVLPAAASILPSIGAALGSLAPAVAPLGAALASLAPVITAIAQALAGAMAGAIQALAPVVIGLAPPLAQIVELIGGALVQAWGLLAPLLPPIVDILSQVASMLINGLQQALVTLTPYLGQIVQVLGQLLVQALGAVMPLMQPLISAFLSIVSAVLPLIDPLLQIVQALLPPLIGLIPMLVPLITLVADSFGQILPPLLAVVTTLTGALIPIITALMPIVQMVFGALVSIISWAMSTVIVPLLTGVVIPLIQGLADAFSWAINSVILPVWRALSAGLSWVWENVIRPAFDAVKDAVHGVGQAFQDAVDWIGRVWDKMKEIAAKPINFIIETVYNQGILKLWNSVAGFLGLGDDMKLKPMNPVAFAGGGVLGGYAPGRDVIPALLSPGESVLTPEATRAIGPQNILALNAALSGRPATVLGGFSGGGIIPRFAGGGVIDSIAGFLGDIGSNVVDLFKDPFGWITGHFGGTMSTWARGMFEAPVQLIGRVGDFLWQQVKSLFSGGSGGASGDLAGWIHAAMKITGVGDDWFGPLSTLIMRESSGNPKAINLTDINAQNGIPSQGLMQTIPPTFAAYRDQRLPNDITDPVANIVAGINYIKSRYGSIWNVQQANAGAPPMGYDSGGYLPPGYSTVFNGTGKPEAVFTSEQWATLARGTDGPQYITGTLDLGNGLIGFVDGRIESAGHTTGTAITTRRR